jgi:5-(carboxyamino)imidazole ribonucleotide mutase
VQQPNAAKIAIVLGSDSDWPAMQPCRELLGHFGLASDVRVISAHRTPQALSEFAARADERGYRVIIAAAGMAAALPGAIAAHTILPVIGVPIATGTLGGLDALLSIAQMPPGVAVGCVAVNGARNAAILAAQIIGVGEPQVARKLQEYRSSLAAEADRQDQSLQGQIAGK